MKRGTPFLYEIKKLIGIRFIWIILALLLGANMLICYSTVENKLNEKTSSMLRFLKSTRRTRRKSTRIWSIT